MSNHTLVGKNVLVAAGAKNLGGLISRRAAEMGANVAIHYNSESTRPAAEETLAAVEALGRKGVLLTGDLTVPANVERLFGDAEAALGSIDVAVNTVGKVLHKQIADTTEDEYDSMSDMNAKATYAGGKSPVEHFTRTAAKEFAGRGISVSAVAPGPMDTPFFYGQETPERVAFHKSQAMGDQLTQIEDIAPIVTFLATDGWWITGQTIIANGGYTTR